MIGKLITWAVRRWNEAIVTRKTGPSVNPFTVNTLSCNVNYLSPWTRVAIFTDSMVGSLWRNGSVFIGVLVVAVTARWVPTKGELRFLFWPARRLRHRTTIAATYRVFGLFNNQLKRKYKNKKTWMSVETRVFARNVYRHGPKGNKATDPPYVAFRRPRCCLDWMSSAPTVRSVRRKKDCAFSRRNSLFLSMHWSGFRVLAPPLILMRSTITSVGSRGNEPVMLSSA